MLCAFVYAVFCRVLVSYVLYIACGRIPSRACCALLHAYLHERPSQRPLVLSRMQINRRVSAERSSIICWLFWKEPVQSRVVSIQRRCDTRRKNGYIYIYRGSRYRQRLLSFCPRCGVLASREPAHLTIFLHVKLIFAMNFDLPSVRPSCLPGVFPARQRAHLDGAVRGSAGRARDGAEQCSEGERRVLSHGQGACGSERPPAGLAGGATIGMAVSVNAVFGAVLQAPLPNLRGGLLDVSVKIGPYRASAC